MEKLERKGLYGGGLIEIKSPILVERYNACLAEIGIEPTKREYFSIDSGGWSPQIADDQGSEFYLTRGDTNQYAIILTPDQEGLPLYAPTHTFDWYILRELFQKAGPQICGLTGKTGVLVEIDHGLSGFTDIDDLLMIESVTATARTPIGLMQAAKDQRALVAKFRDEPLAWLDANLRTQIVESAKAHGDLRHRPLVIPDIPFLDVRCFYTRAFGGVYVLRDLSDEKSLLVCEDRRRSRGSVLSITDRRLIEQLLESGHVELPLDWYREHPDKLERLRDCLLVHTLYDEDPELEYLGLQRAQRRELIRKFKSVIPNSFFETERLLLALKNGKDDAKIKISEELAGLLYRPKRSLTKVARRTVAELLAHLHQEDVWRLYHFRKQIFFETYRSWPARKQQWAVELVSAEKHKQARVENP